MIRGGMVRLHVRDIGSAVRFYIETLGMKLVAEPVGSAIIDAGEGFDLLLVAGTTSTADVVLRTKVPLEVAVAIYENRGVVFERGAGGALFGDPDGNRFTLVQG